MTRYQARRKPWPPHRRFEPRPSVHWLSPSELVDAGVRAVISKIFGDYADRRETFAMFTPHATTDDPEWEQLGFFLEGERDQDEFWFDYVSDVGDGFSPTFTIAEALARDVVEVEVGGVTVGLNRGQMLVMGGDEVYPTPSAKGYRDRTTGPYEAALQYLEPVDEATDRPGATLYAIPGNHDWYDGLSAFLKQFCSRQWIGGWKSRQHRSYFAIALPRSWWLWGIDIAFDAPIDGAQMDYFRRAADLLEPGDSVILVTAKPSWKDCEQADDEISDERYNNIRYFVAQTVGRHSEGEVRLMLAGDKHFYARYIEQGSFEPAAAQKIIAGGGGAYLSSTAGLRDCISLREPSRDQPGTGIATSYDLAAAWPSKQRSKRLAWHALWRLPQTTRLYGTIGVIAAGLAWLLRRALDDTVLDSLPPSIQANPLADEVARSLPTSEVVASLARAPLDAAFMSDAMDYGPLWLAMGAMVVMLLPFARKGSARGGRPLTVVLAVLHAGGYLLAAALAMAAAARAAVEVPFASGIAIAMIAVVVVVFWITEAAPLLRVRKFATPMVGTSILVVAWTALTSLNLSDGAASDFRTTFVYVASLVIVGGFLGTGVLSLYLIAASLLGRNMNELFTAIRSEHYKNFLRMKIDGEGVLHVWALGIRDPGDRRIRWDDDGELLIDSGSPILVEPQLIDHVVITRRSVAAGPRNSAETPLG